MVTMRPKNKAPEFSELSEKIETSKTFRLTIADNPAIWANWSNWTPCKFCKTATKCPAVGVSNAHAAHPAHRIRRKCMQLLQILSAFNVGWAVKRSSGRSGGWPAVGIGRQHPASSIS